MSRLRLGRLRGNNESSRLDGVTRRVASPLDRVRTSNRDCRGRARFAAEAATRGGDIALLQQAWRSSRLRSGQSCPARLALQIGIGDGRTLPFAAARSGARPQRALKATAPEEPRVAAAAPLLSANPIVRTIEPARLPAWQRHSEAGAAARVEAVVTRSGPARLDVGDCDSAPGLLGGRFRASTITCCVAKGRTGGRRDLDHPVVAWPGVAVISSLPARALLPIVRSSIDSSCARSCCVAYERSSRPGSGLGGTASTATEASHETRACSRQRKRGLADHDRTSRVAVVGQPLGVHQIGG